MKFLTYKNEFLNSIVIGLYFKSGPLYETKRKNGITHLVEHLFFREVNGISQEELYYQMESIGTTLRAKTYHAFTSFEIKVIPKYFKEAVNIISNILVDFEWSKDAINAEKEIVKKEIELKSTSYYDFVDNLYFKKTKQSYPIMGTVENINNLTLDDINRWKKKYFNCANVCVVLTGAFSTEDYIHAKNKFESINNKGISAKREKIIPKDFSLRNTSSDHIFSWDDYISDVWISFDLSQNKEKKLMHARLISSFLGEGVGSRLALKLREQNHLLYSITSTIYTYSDCARLMIEFSALNSELEKALRLIFKEICSIKQHITSKDYNSCIKFFTDNQKIKFDDTKELNFDYAWNTFILSDEKYDLYDIAKLYEKITINDLKTAANLIFSGKNMIINVRNNNSIYKKKQLKQLLEELRDSL